MIKRMAIKKIMVSTICLILFLLFYFIPTHDSIEYEINISKSKSEKVVYLLDEDNYVSRVISYFDSNNINEEVRKRIDILMNGYNIFYGVIPTNTKLNSIKVDKNNIYLDFSSDLLNINKYMSESFLEAITYTLTEINGINNVYIDIDGKRLNKLNDINISYPLNRNIGINKEYNISNLNSLNKTTVYFSKVIDEYKYYVPVTKIYSDDEEKIEVIIKELKSSVNSQNNLNGYFENNVDLLKYIIDDDNISLVFNKVVNNNTEVILCASIFENYNVNSVTFKYNDNDIVIKKDDLKSLDF